VLHSCDDLPQESSTFHLVDHMEGRNLLTFVLESCVSCTFAQSLQCVLEWFLYRGIEEQSCRTLIHQIDLYQSKLGNILSIALFHQEEESSTTSQSFGSSLMCHMQTLSVVQYKALHACGMRNGPLLLQYGSTLGTSRRATPIRGGHLTTFPYIYSLP
jgi:hypothetical protein